MITQKPSYKVFKKNITDRNGLQYKYSIFISHVVFDFIQKSIKEEIIYGYPKFQKYMPKAKIGKLLLPLKLIGTVSFLDETQTRFINHVLKNPLNEQSRVCLVIQDSLI